jgi:hypothetical protein
MAVVWRKLILRSKFRRKFEKNLGKYRYYFIGVVNP